MRSAIVGLEGKECFGRLRFEAGVHRVQRIPLTDKTRVHTSTTSVTVLPEPENVRLVYDFLKSIFLKFKPELIISSKDVKIETMRASGPGGQNVNKRSTAVRITHLETGISLKVMEERHQYENIKVGIFNNYESKLIMNCNFFKIAYRRLAGILLQNKVDAVASNFKTARKLQAYLIIFLYF